MWKYFAKRNARKLKHFFEALLHTKRVPAPYLQKHALLLDFFPAESTVVETGTYLGETTELLRGHCRKVVSIEPYDPLYEYNARRFGPFKNVTVVHGSSEQCFEAVVENLTGDISFWLDGHYSGDGTHGSLDTASPIMRELEVIGNWLASNDGGVHIAIDDARLFLGRNGYPEKSQIYDFALNNALVCLEFRDIFFLKKAV